MSAPRSAGAWAKPLSFAAAAAGPKQPAAQAESRAAEVKSIPQTQEPKKSMAQVAASAAKPAAAPSAAKREAASKKESKDATQSPPPYFTVGLPTLGLQAGPLNSLRAGC